MSKRAVEFHEGAIEEAISAYDWYSERNLSAAKMFISELDRALDRIVTAPKRYPAFILGTRRCLLRRFPYLIVYRERSEAIEVIAIAHAHRRPGYWKDRLH